MVGDVKYEGLDIPTAPAYYLPFLQNPQRGMNLIVSASLPPPRSPPLCARRCVTSIRRFRSLA